MDAELAPAAREHSPDVGPERAFPVFISFGSDTPKVASAFWKGRMGDGKSLYP
jgi:hypothetical protein